MMLALCNGFLTPYSHLSLYWEKWVSEVRKGPERTIPAGLQLGLGPAMTRDQLHVQDITYITCTPKKTPGQVWLCFYVLILCLVLKDLVYLTHDTITTKYLMLNYKSAVLGLEKSPKAWKCLHFHNIKILNGLLWNLGWRFYYKIQA